MSGKILVIGASGQIGAELTMKLRSIHGSENVIAADIREGSEELTKSGPFEILDATDREKVGEVCRTRDIQDVYLMAAMLSATGERFPDKAWKLNMDSLFIVLDLAKEKVIQRIFWPSSIAVFGPTTPKINTPQHTIMEPTTVYGISKQTGERWCEYYHKKYGVDVRSIRYPGLISWKTLPGGGTTDYAVDIFHKAIEHKSYTCFLSAGTALPMMYMHDAIRATVDLMDAPASQIKERSSYNLSGMSFTPQDIADAIIQHIPEFTINYEPDSRQQIADSWPSSIDDTPALEDWNWKAAYDLEATVSEMLEHLS
ncbi:Nucleoside-diphosphate-sugar epimerase [Nonlabens sp. Hel1_33_55]|uniref:NAD-dependent epimerase/dehydratase family protein n=1 Tax=Nonlabens sp. Hel1_33_55 TaxID=1336802 RepID=UPI000875E018|nr:NAD-dependent epimerase/dehydratase family protein [Nonlabens sp. Hel1_33_55]SCY26679.1 Nucleoside-diphosphate-sugar epimerase [Nonlabens sp. Hel1_33_55]